MEALLEVPCGKGVVPAALVFLQCLDITDETGCGDDLLYLSQLPFILGSDVVAAIHPCPNGDGHGLEVIDITYQGIDGKLGSTDARECHHCACRVSRCCNRALWALNQRLSAGYGDSSSHSIGVPSAW